MATQKDTARCFGLVFLSLLTLPISLGVLYFSALKHTIKSKFGSLQVTTSDGQRTILVTGVGMAKGLTLARAFYLSGHRVIGADIEDHIIPCSGRYSKSLSTFYRLPRPYSSSRAEIYTNLLVQIIKDEKVDLWVSCSGVASAIEDAQAKEAIEAQTTCRCIQFDVATTSMLHEKNTFMHTCAERGLAIPDTHEVTSRDGVLQFLSASKMQHPDRKYILKPVGMDDVNRGDMTLLPLSSHVLTEKHISRLFISASTPWILQQFIPGGEEYCTHALVVRGELKCFVSCPSSELLMHYEPLSQDDELWRAMHDFTVEFLQRSPDADSMTGHLSFDFMVDSGPARGNRIGSGKSIYAIECNPRAHTAVVLFAQQGPEMRDMVQAYLSAIDRPKGALVDHKTAGEQKLGGEKALVTPPKVLQSRYWIGNDVVTLLFHPLLRLAMGSIGRKDVSKSSLIFLEHMVHWKEGTFETWDPFPALILYHVYWPLTILSAWWQGRRWKPDVVTFAELHELSRIAAVKIRQILPENENDLVSVAVGLFCHSSLDLVLSWLGLVHLGRKAFFYAPQLEVHTIEHLCEEVGVRVILVDSAHRGLLSQITGDINAVEIPNYHSTTNPNDNVMLPKIENRSASSVSFLQHTSGTSSGLPKPIFQTEWGAVGCLPVFTDPEPIATFTTTPLYHGGLADAFRAWTSRAMIWFFPEGVTPITGSNIVKVVNFARRRSGVARVKYFSSVPYVLEMLAKTEDGSGVEMLRLMDLVGVGGAPLPPAVGDRLVRSGVKLLSRMGSAECGFLMSSHREYAKDSGWQYLRAIDDPELLAFEPRDGGLSELVVRCGWPLRLKQNREDGSYATADLFEPHPSIQNAWRYYGRADALIILANGKKFDPSPIEDELRSSDEMLRDVLVFGAERNYPGALLFTDCQDLSDDEFLGKVWPAIEKMNLASPQHSRILRSAVVIIRVKQGDEPLPKSSKGTILRRQAESRYAEDIGKAYDSPGVSPGKTYIPDDELVSVITTLFIEILGRPVATDKDVYAQGVDSISCIQITKRMQDTLLLSDAEVLPQNIIYDNSTILELADTLKRIRRESSCLNYSSEEKSLELMRQLAEKYSHVEISGNKNLKETIVVVLTGASGTLGAHILNQLIDDSRVKKIYCLLRGSTGFTTEQRIVKALVKRKLRNEEELKCLGLLHGRIICLSCDLSLPNLGLLEKDRARTTNDATHFIHSAWAVNFNLGLKSYESQLANTKNLIETADVNGAEFFFISSTAAVSNTASGIVQEKVSSEPRNASALGYSRSKWVAEQMCTSAHIQAINSGNLRSDEKPRISIIRVGQLCGNEFGVWNVSEAYPLLLSTTKLTSCLPDLPGEALNWLPVDTAARSIIEIALPLPIKDTSTQDGCLNIPVYHVVNHHETPSWRQMLRWFSEGPSGIPFDIVSASTWMELLEAKLKTDSVSRHPCRALIGLWKQRYVLEDSANNSDSRSKSPMFEVSFTRRLSESINKLKPLDRERVVRMWEWIQENC
ncbi:hypothetical protein NUW58_g783 [Xylaria curta]|uniref:Uncharacterized protein n=1 Tax=Xylaria curta TaxID=42375 RepID=A0ACC1PPR7_9PEZI|nr:hypothetical protein NUW58_g783 [Xylaria curta]